MADTSLSAGQSEKSMNESFHYKSKQNAFPVRVFGVVPVPPQEVRDFSFSNDAAKAIKRVADKMESDQHMTDGYQNCSWKPPTIHIIPPTIHVP